MAIAFRAISAMGSGTTSVAVTTPATALNNDVLVAFIGDRGTAAAGTTAPTGWTKQVSTGNANGRIQVFTAIVGQGGVTANQSTTWTGLTTACIGVISAYSGVDNITPCDVTPVVRTNPSGTTGCGQAVVASYGCYVVLGFTSATNGSTWSAYNCATNPTSANLTERIDAANGTTNSIAVADGARNPATAGGTGIVTATMATAGTNQGALVVLRSSLVGQDSDGITGTYTPSGALSTNLSSTEGVTTGETDSGVIVGGGTTYPGSTSDGVTTAEADSGVIIPGPRTYPGSTSDGVTVSATNSANVHQGTQQGSTVDGVVLNVINSVSGGKPVVSQPPQGVGGFFDPNRYERVRRERVPDRELHLQHNVVFQVRGLHARVRLGAVRGRGGRGLGAYAVPLRATARLNSPSIDAIATHLTDAQLQLLLGKTTVETTAEVYPSSYYIRSRMGTPRVKAVRNPTDEELIHLLSQIL